MQSGNQHRHEELYGLYTTDARVWHNIQNNSDYKTTLPFEATGW